jgi:hypothetical protein
VRFIDGLLSLVFADIPTRHRSRILGWAWCRGTSGYPSIVEADVRIRKVEEIETRSGKTRYVVQDEHGREYTTFRPGIGREAANFEGRRAHIEFHEQERNGFQNVYLDAISAAADRQEPVASTDPDESAWRTAVEAAPWVLGTREPDHEVPAEELYEKLEPFKRLVAEDIRERGEPDPE